MKKQHLLIALVCFLLPVLLRSAWFFRGFYFGNSHIRMPDYASLTVSQPTLSTAIPAVVSAQDERITVLFDQAHNNQFSLAEIETLRSELLTQGAEVAALTTKGDLSEQLRKANAFVIITPVNHYSESEIEAIEEFVQRGGRLLVIADPTRSFSEYDTERAESVMLVNEILQPYRLSFRNDYAYNLSHNEGNYRNVYVHPSGRDALSASVSELVFYAAHSLDIYDQRILGGDENTLSSLDDLQNDLSLAALDASGNVLAVGDMTFMTRPYDQVSDNHRFIRNMASFLINGRRLRNLNDFPYLFNRSIAIEFTSGISLDKDLLAVIADVKALYSQGDLSLEILSEPDPQLERIVLGIYPPDEQLKIEIAPFEIGFNGFVPTAAASALPVLTGTPTSQLNEENGMNSAGKTGADGKYFQVPGFGSVPSKGFGFILFKQGEEANTLYLLADSPENAVLLLHLIVKGSLEDCLVEETIAVCEQTAIAKSDDIAGEITPEVPEELLIGQTLTPPATPTLEGESTPTPTETPTPAPESD